MVIPNVGAFIAWGLLTALFIPTGWLPNEDLAEPVGPMITYVLPLLLAFTGGKLVHGHRGGVAGAVGTIGLIVGADIPMFLGAMIMGPLSAWLIKQVDRVLEPRIRSGFEMVVNNFTLGFLGLGLIVATYRVIGPVISALNDQLLRGINALVDTGALPLLSLLNEPAKVLFLNNVIDQGIYYPLGLQVAADEGSRSSSWWRPTPVPGLGLLLAFWLFGHNRVIRDSAPGAVIIHFLGGIHEIYFPYVLMKPSTIIAMIAGGASGIATFMALRRRPHRRTQPGLDLRLPGPHSPRRPRRRHRRRPRRGRGQLRHHRCHPEAREQRGDDDVGDLEEHAERSRAMKAEGSAVLSRRDGRLERHARRQRTYAGSSSPATPAWAAARWARAPSASGCASAGPRRRHRDPRGDRVRPERRRPGRRAPGPRPPGRAARPDVEIVTIQSYLGDPALDALSDRLTERTTTDAEQ